MGLGRFAGLFFCFWAAVFPFALDGQTQALSFRPVDAQYSTALDRMIMISGNPDLLHIYNAASNNDVTVALPAAALNVSVSPDGLHAAVAHAASVSYVDLQSANIQSSLPADVGTGQVVLGASYAYVFPSTWGDTLKSINLATGAVTTIVPLSSAGRLDPVTNALYGTNDQQSPNQLVRYNVSTGPVTAMTDSPYFDTFPICSDLWFSPYGTRIYDGCATVYLSSSDTTKDMTYVTSFQGLEGIQSLSTSSSLGQVALIPSSSQFYASAQTQDDGEVRLFESGHLNQTGRFVLSSFQVGATSYAAHGHLIAYNQTSSALFVLMEADSTSGLLNDFAIQTIQLSNPATCSVTLSAPADTPASGSLETVNVTAGTNCSYTAVSGSPWIALGSGFDGGGNNVLTYVVRA